MAARIGLLRMAALGSVLLWQVAALCQTPAAPIIDIQVLDRDGHPVAEAQVEIKAGVDLIAAGRTDTGGRVVFLQLKPGHYDISAAKAGFGTLLKKDIDLTQPGDAAIELTLVPALNQREHVEVHETIESVQQGSSPPTQLNPAAAKDLPGRPATVADALPLIPGVVRSPAGDLQISGVGEHRSSLIVNSADVTDPATGQFGLTVPIDSVETLSVFQTPFLAEYGRFSAGLVSVHTRRGGDTWKWEINDPFPDFRIRSYHMRGVRDASPRLNVEGPIIAH
ncbi:MAG TPA: carboxypeptidase regulatory-like domain-containing protein, partial [Bryobacteraceae bacterium]